MVKTDHGKALVELLRSAGVCSRCILRFLCVRSYLVYSSKDEILKRLNSFQNASEKCSAVTEAVDVEPPAKRLHSAPCSLCLGILEDECDAMISKIQEFIVKSGFEFTDFVLQLSVPVAVDLRENLFCLYIKDQLCDAELKEVDIPSVKEVWKWVVGYGLSTALNVDFTPNSDFQLFISITYPNLVDECNKLLGACPSAFPNRRKPKVALEFVYNRTSVMKAIECLSTELRNLYPLPPESPSAACTYGEICCSHSPLYLAGKYNKYTRELSQTPWVVDGERRMESSVQELITNVVRKRIKADSIVFSASGREDVDVKMLGNGRPFVLELINPRQVNFSVEEIKAIEREINVSTSDISVNLLQIVSKAEIKRLKEGEEEKRKMYSALCFVKKALTSEDLKLLEELSEVKIKQKTPIRVLHRRTLATRDRIIHKISGKIIGLHTIELHLETQAGTYVKEFIHGDFGRTVPSFGSLLQTEADILELDVESIDLDWPPDPEQLKCDESSVTSNFE